MRRKDIICALIELIWYGQVLAARLCDVFGLHLEICSGNSVVYCGEDLHIRLCLARVSCFELGFCVGWWLLFLMSLYGELSGLLFVVEYSCLKLYVKLFGAVFWRRL